MLVVSVFEIFRLTTSVLHLALGENTFVVANPLDGNYYVRTFDGVNLFELPDFVMVLLLAENPLALEVWAGFLVLVDALFGSHVSSSCDFAVLLSLEKKTGFIYFV